ncbi:probable ADP-ribosylation factor GTPase-activating protein AGD14 isoform X1 [Amaranthus tricolor]|uniref:probable ADP-ribosylation factor GTPase-activating protein AGD14 isoform X1 n=1 Tax=Amaranthus tricolor TaxID=29722 RepID=UPI002590FCA4|nr:probable ADP-ribosylation factor GTPase-activating protein AGD14 isoform X1 [Amaranthus tricolor]
MATKREEERNEKIIRGLMKLPPNRCCINCNNLGPQYVCTTFWTFVCMICSGIHREFTHRVKSVSMSKFTSQEVEALQNGGNQRAREIYLKNWDLHRQRQPNSSNVDKIREFIKAVYIDRKYAAGNNSEKPPRDMQSQMNVGDETRRASSYHSFSQSPPYDFQYEDRLKRKPIGSLTRKAASFIYSPGRFSEHFYEDRFANEGSSSRVSDYSMSSGGDPFKSGQQSPNLQKDDGFSSPNSDSSREIIDGLHRQTSSTYTETYAKRDIDKAPLPRPQRTVSSGSVGSYEKNSVSLQSTGSGTLFEVEPNHSNATSQNKVSTIPSTSQLRAENFGGLDLFEEAPTVSASNSVSGCDFFQAPKDGFVASTDLFQSAADSSVVNQNFPQAFYSSSSAFLSHSSQNPPCQESNQKVSEPSEPIINEGWATFDLPKPSPVSTVTLSTAGSGAGSKAGISLAFPNSVSPSNDGLHWPNFYSSNVRSPPSLVSDPWNEGAQNVYDPSNVPSSQMWKAFEDANEQGINLQVSTDITSLRSDLKTSEDSVIDGIQKTASVEGFSFPILPSNVTSGSSFIEPNHPFMSEIANVQKMSGNPFDVPFDSELEPHNTFLDMSTLQAALPSTPPPSSYIDGMNEPWFPPNHVPSPGGLPYMMAQVPSSQLQNVPAHGPAASFGGNPFA